MGSPQKSTIFAADSFLHLITIRLYAEGLNSTALFGGLCFCFAVASIQRGLRWAQTDKIRGLNTPLDIQPSDFILCLCHNKEARCLP